MAINKTFQGLLTPVGGRTTVGRDIQKLVHPSCLTILFISITGGGTASIDIEVSDDPDELKFFPIKSAITVDGVHRISMPSSLIATNVTEISGANVEVRYRILVLDNAPEYAIDTFEEGDITARRIEVSGVLTADTVNATRKKLAQTEIAATPTTIYTVPTGKQASIRTIVLASTDLSSRTVSLWHDGTADTNIILPPVTILAGGFGVFSGDYSMEAGDTLVADADAANSVTITVSGVEEPIPA